ncbi:MAG: bacterial transcriptional activator domain-containing protein [bacterium]|nr:bacterial transcriptional activator domain-containing protein [bacterium]
MNLHRVIAAAYDTFIEYAQKTRVILLHPTSRYRTMLVAHLLNDPRCLTFYYALGHDDVNLNAFMAGITHDIAGQHPLFGRHTLPFLPNAAANLDELLQAFVHDLAELSTTDHYLILDEYDRSDTADDIQYFIEKLSPMLPEHCHLVINSRTLPRLPWVSMIAQGRALMIRDEVVIRNHFYEAQRGNQHLEVYALGPGFVILNDKIIDAWEGHLPRLLFFFALDRPVITRSEICQTFWPELDNDQAVNVFHVTKRRLHKALDMDVLVHEDGYYSINPDLDVHYDVINFVGYLMEGRNPAAAQPLLAWQRAIDTYRGPFLQGHEDAWIIDRRRDFQAGFLEALMSLAADRIREGRYEHALGLYQRALIENSVREDLHRGLMELFARLGRRSEAAAHFLQLQEDVRKAGREVEAQTTAVYLAIMD